jgi:hypothetical protein
MVKTINEKTKRKKKKVIKVKKIITAADLVEDERGRPILYEWNEDDIKKIKSMATIGLKVSQIAAIMGCSLPVIDRRIAEGKARWESGDYSEPNIYDILEKARSQGDGKIAKTIYEVATEDRHPTMLIWLSKVRLGWREQIDVNQEVKHTVVYETQLADGVLRQSHKELPAGEIIDALIAEVTDEVCPKTE